jgi:hypothetical protein
MEKCRSIGFAMKEVYPDLIKRATVTSGNDFKAIFSHACELFSQLIFKPVDKKTSYKQDLF